VPTRIGLLGGTFDPPHLGHLVVAEVARVALDLDGFHLVVAGDPWMKSEISPAEDRIRMVELAVEEDEHLHVNRMEADRDGPTYTAETLRVMRAERSDAELFFLVGADAAQKLGEWKQIERALELARFVVISRPGYEVALDTPLLRGVMRLPVPSIGISSTDLRRRFRDHEAVRYQLPDVVESYVRQRGLYGAKPEAPGR
jgi:nicotinate-nucleotide adenylyltransferase